MVALSQVRVSTPIAASARVCRGVRRVVSVIRWLLVSSYVKIGVGFGGWRWVQTRSEIRLLRTRMASLWVFPRVMSFW